MRRALLFFAFATGHLVLFLGLFTATWVIADRSDPHVGSGPTVRVLDFITQVLWLPVSLIPTKPDVLRSLGTAGKYLPFVVNSFVWAGVATSIMAMWRRRHRAG
jgi:hypothetical protein